MGGLPDEWPLRPQAVEVRSCLQRSATTTHSQTRSAIALLSRQLDRTVGEVPQSSGARKPTPFACACGSLAPTKPPHRKNFDERVSRAQERQARK